MWDYPVREQYTHLLKVIKQTGTFTTPEEGYAAVDAALWADFAFIHDSREVCTVVGMPERNRENITNVM